jgi:hypothetical protein
MTPRVRRYAAEEGARYGLTADQVLSQTRGQPEQYSARRAVILRLHRDKFTVGQICRWIGRTPSTVRYVIDPGYRAAQSARMKARHAERNARNRERYATDAAFREKRKAWARFYA